MKSQRKIALIGPQPPIRGGIARHTACIGRAISDDKTCLLRSWGFSRQYPKRLYPGNDERDAFLPKSLAVEETLDGVNPLSWQRTARAVRDWGADIIVAPAWTFFLSPAIGYVMRNGAGPQTERVVVVHNAFDHEAARWKDKISRWQLAAADRFVTHNQALATVLRSNFPDVPVDVFPHPIFDDFPTPVGTLERRGRLELLFFGLVRPYKGVDVLVEAMTKVTRKDVYLTIAGEFWEGLDEIRATIASAGLSDQIELIPRFVPDDEAAELFERSDAVVLPYRSVTGSGVVSNALYFGRGVIASDLPGLAEVIEDGETGWLVPTGDAGGLAARIDALEPEETKRVGQGARAYGETLSWDRFATVVLGDA